jgi:hypothetical protein
MMTIKVRPPSINTEAGFNSSELGCHKLVSETMEWIENSSVWVIPSRLTPVA